MPGAIVVGASSGIGEALAYRLAREGYAVALLARRADRLNAACGRINAEFGEGHAFAYPHDVARHEDVPRLFGTILRDLGSVAVVVYCAGVVERVGLAEYDFDKDRRMIEVNALGAIAWLNQAAMLFERMRSGHIVGISSIAGERGRVRSPVYNASKAALTTYLEALRNRLTRKGVHVLTIKPGFVDTDLLKGYPNPFWVISADRAAAHIWKSIRRGRQTVFVPARWGLVALVLRHIPSPIFRRLSV